MFEEQFEVLFQTVQTICNRIDSTDSTERVHLKSKLSEIHEIGVSWLDQWMALEEKLTDAFDKLGEIKQQIHSRTSFDETIRIRYTPEPEKVELESIVFDMTSESQVALRRGMAYFDLLMFEEAKASLEHAVPHTDEPTARLFLAASYTALGHLADAKIQLESLKAFLKTPTLVCAGAEIEAVICLHEGNIEGAIRAYLNALCAMPSYSDVWFNLGACYLAVKEPVAAERMLAHVLKQDENDKEAWLLYIYALVQQGSYQEAFCQCTKAMEAFPSDHLLMAVYSHICQLVNDLKQGEFISRKMIQQYPLRQEGYLHASWYALYRADTGHTQALLKKMLSIHPNHPIGMLQLAVSQMLSQNGIQKQDLLAISIGEPYDSVLAIVRGMKCGDEEQIECAIQSPNLSIRKLALYTCGMLLKEKGKYLDAMKFLLSASEIGKSNYAILAALHDVALALGKTDEARIFLEEAYLAEK